MTKEDEDFIKNFHKNRDLNAQFSINNKEIKKSINGKDYIEFTLSDKSGEIKGRMFPKNIQEIYNAVQTGEVITTIGKIQEFPKDSGKYNIIIKKIYPIKTYDEEDFVRKLPNKDEKIEEIEKLIETIDDVELRQLIDAIFDEETLNKFYNAPAAKFHHHNYIGGLLEHTLEVMVICQAISKLYPQIDRNILITGALLHDIGKIEIYSYDNAKIDINQKGQLLEHLYISAQLIEEKSKEINLSDEKRLHLIHMALSHHGDKDLGWGSAADPKTVEAVALHQADDLSAKIRNNIQE
ncbi:MAG: HD domain-containing protein [Methanobacteriaceae archaeon]|nr:HD domain-containing protein [Methanobacteriaceae archaeon]